MKSYAPELARDPALVALWQKVRTEEDPEWTRRYHTTDPREKAFGGRVVITFTDGHSLTDEIAVANAHPLGSHPLARPGYVRKFEALTEDLLGPEERGRFLDTAQRLPKLPAAELGALNLALPPEKLACATRDHRGIF